MMAILIRLRDVLPLLAALVLVVLCFALPPIYADEAEPATAEAETTRVLIIDAGHGGEDGGATTAEGVPESGINLAIAQKLEALAGLCGVESVMTRENQDINYPESASTTAQRKQADQKARIELINAQSDAVLISIHQNFFPTCLLYTSCFGMYPVMSHEKSLSIAHLLSVLSLSISTVIMHRTFC